VIISFLPALVDHSVVVDLDSGGHDVLDRGHELGQKSHHLQAFSRTDPVLSQFVKCMPMSLCRT
jgi:hypothetical protein